MSNQPKNNTATTSDYISGYKVIEVNMTTSTENLYAVVTPVKTK